MAFPDKTEINQEDVEKSKLASIGNSELDQAFRILYWLEISSTPKNAVQLWSMKIDKILNKHCISCFKVNFEINEKSSIFFDYFSKQFQNVNWLDQCMYNFEDVVLKAKFLKNFNCLDGLSYI